MYRESSCGNLLQVEAAVLYPGLRPTVLRIRLRYNYCFFRALVLKFDNKNLANSCISSFFFFIIVLTVSFFWCGGKMCTHLFSNVII